MAQAPRILAFAGSTRAASYNKQLLRNAVDATRAAGADVTVLDLADLPLPLYDGDLEKREGLPPNARKLREAMLAHRGLLIASPEYNSSISAVMKNTIDWATRSETGTGTLEAFQDKIALLISASPGVFGGMRALVHLRAILGNIGVLVLPDQLALAKAHEALDAEGALKDEKQRATLGRITLKLVTTVAKLSV
jgi:chromate reductase, NAD(P)H dehydrogenase (quinone)